MIETFKYLPQQNYDANFGQLDLQKRTSKCQKMTVLIPSRALHTKSHCFARSQL